MKICVDCQEPGLFPTNRCGPCRRARVIQQTALRASSSRVKKRLIRKRGQRCEKCGAEGPVEMHHKQPVINDGGLEETNLVLLCKVCHLAERNIGLHA